MKEHSNPSSLKSSNSDYINKCIKNVLNNISCPERLACFVVENTLVCHIGGSNKFIYDPETKDIVKQLKDAWLYDFNTVKINTDNLDEIFRLKSNTIVKKSNLEEVREKYNISKKRLSQKDYDEILKYENNRRKNNST